MKITNIDEDWIKPSNLILDYCLFMERNIDLYDNNFIESESCFKNVIILQKGLGDGWFINFYLDDCCCKIKIYDIDIENRNNNVKNYKKFRIWKRKKKINILNGF